MFDMFRRQNFMYSLLSVIFGLILVLYPGHTLNLMVSVVGWGLLIMGILALIGFITGWRNYQTFAVAAVGLVIGIWIMVKPSFFVSIIPFIVGLLIFINSCTSAYQTVKSAKNGYAKWGRNLVVAIIGAVLGVLIMINPFATAGVVVTIAGIGMIYSGIMGLLISTI